MNQYNLGKHDSSQFTAFRKSLEKPGWSLEKREEFPLSIRTNHPGILGAVFFERDHTPIQVDINENHPDSQKLHALLFKHFPDALESEYSDSKNWPAYELEGGAQATRNITKALRRKKTFDINMVHEGARTTISIRESAQPQSREREGKLLAAIHTKTIAGKPGGPLKAKIRPGQTDILELLQEHALPKPKGKTTQYALSGEAKHTKNILRDLERSGFDTHVREQSKGEVLIKVNRDLLPAAQFHHEILTPKSGEDSEYWTTGGPTKALLYGNQPEILAILKKHAKPTKQ